MKRSKIVNFNLLFSIFFCVLVFNTSGYSSSQKPEPLKLMSWNVRNYNLCNRYIYGQYRLNYPKPESEKEALRAVIKNIQPDVLFLQEIGGKPFLLELIKDLSFHDQLEYNYYEIAEAEDKNRMLGVISKLPLNKCSITSEPLKKFQYFDNLMRVKRGCLKMELTYDNQSITLLAVHLKSRYTSDKRDPQSKIRREKEARTIRDQIRTIIEHHPHEKIIILGDFNDHANSATYRRFTQYSKNPFLKEVSLKDNHGERWTYFYETERRYEQIDYAFLNKELAKYTNWNIEGQIINHPQVSQASDHRPILIQISVNSSNLQQK